MSNPETWKSWQGRVVDGKYNLGQWLGGSDHSAVFVTEVPGSPVQKSAIKLIAAENGPAAERQVSAVRATTKLSHPNLIRTLATGRCQMNGTPLAYVVMEYAEEDLSQILPQRKLEPSEVAELLPPLLDALSYLHRKSLVHSGIRPSNVLAVGDQLKLSCDRVASSAGENGHRRRDLYDAPETAAGIFSPAGDVWSLGMTVVAALTQNVASASEASKADPGLPANVPEPFRSIARECLHLDPNQRCSLDQIQGWLQSGKKPADVEQVQSVPPAATPRPRRAFPVTIALGVILAAVFAAIYFRGHKSDVNTGTPVAQQQPTSTPATSVPQPSEKPHPTAGSVVHQAIPEIPQSAKNTITGTIKVVVRVQVDTSGKVTSAAFKSAGSSRYFAGHALQSAQHWQFSPPEVDGKPTESTWLIQYRFRRNGIQASAERVAR